MREQAERFVFARLFQVFESGGDVCPGAFAVFSHQVESLPVVGVLCLTEVGHSAVEPVVDYAVAVFSVVESFPSFGRNGEALRTVADVEGGLQVVRTAHRGHGVKVDADDQIGVVGNKCCKVGVYLVGTEFQLVEFLECEVEVVVVGGK